MMMMMDWELGTGWKDVCWSHTHDTNRRSLGYTTYKLLLSCTCHYY